MGPFQAKPNDDGGKTTAVIIGHGDAVGAAARPASSTFGRSISGGFFPSSHPPPMDRSIASIQSHMTAGCQWQQQRPALPVAPAAPSRRPAAAGPAAAGGQCGPVAGSAGMGEGGVGGGPSGGRSGLLPPVSTHSVCAVAIDRCVYVTSRPFLTRHTQYNRSRGVTLARKGGYQLHGSEYKANATTLDLSAHNRIVRVDAVRAYCLSAFRRCDSPSLASPPPFIHTAGAARDPRGGDGDDGAAGQGRVGARDGAQGGGPLPPGHRRRRGTSLSRSSHMLVRALPSNRSPPSIYL